MRYEVLEAGTPNELAASVEIYLRAGWTCLGGVALGIYPKNDSNGEPQPNPWYVQAMITKLE